MIKLAVIADDITGANDTALQFAKRNIKSCVRIDFNQERLWAEAADVIVIDTDSRDLAAVSAYHKVKEVCEILRHSGIEHIYKKVDSTLRGNIGAEIEASAAVFEPEIVVIAPAFPSNHRVTVGGYHLLHNMPIELTEIAHAPKSPVKESRIVELLNKQTDSKIGTVSLTTVMAGVEAIKNAVKECLLQDETWIVFDAVLDEHLENITRATQDYHNVLWVGSAGLAEQLSKVLQWSDKGEIKNYPAEGAVLIVAGSVSNITRAQISAALNSPNIQLINLEAASLFQNKEIEIARCIDEAEKYLQAGKDILIASATSEEDVAAAVRAGERIGLSSSQVSEEIAMALAETVRRLTGHSLAGIVLTGGDTAIHVCRSLGAEAIQVLEEVAVGIPLGRLVGGHCHGLQVVTKAGAFGNENAFLLSVQIMRKKEAQKEA